MEGGKATPITKGLPYDNHPSFSPDGKRILFISDRSGAENLWYIDLEKKDTVALTDDNNQNFPGAVYTPDGNYIVYTKGRRNTKLYLMHKNGGAGTQLISMPLTLITIDVLNEMSEKELKEITKDLEKIALKNGFKYSGPKPIKPEGILKRAQDIRNEISLINKTAETSEVVDKK